MWQVVVGAIYRSGNWLSGLWWVVVPQLKLLELAVSCGELWRVMAGCGELWYARINGDSTGSLLSPKMKNVVRGIKSALVMRGPSSGLVRKLTQSSIYPKLARHIRWRLRTQNTTLLGLSTSQASNSSKAVITPVITVTLTVTTLVTIITVITFCSNY